MKRFQNEWVIDKTMFDFTMRKSGCSCCGMVHSDLQFNFISSISDIDTADAAAENDQSVWPEEVKTSIWADRVAIRKLLKERKKRYKSFLQNFPSFEDWCNSLSIDTRIELGMVSFSSVHGYVICSDCLE